MNDINFTEISGNKGNIGLITLNRPEALNALNLDMIQTLDAQLRVWMIEKTIKAVVVQGSGEKAFCAGGDIRKIYETGRANVSNSAQFFWHEYRLNHLIHHYPKPYIAFLNGITMGGGVGISEHGSHRIATEKLMFAMPETGIGFFPDVGGSYFLPRLPGQTGIYLGLTGARINAADAIYLGLANYFIKTEKLPETITALAASDFGRDSNATIDACLKPLTETLAISQFEKTRHTIDHCFQFNAVEEIVATLNQQSGEWFETTKKLLSNKSPTSLKVTLQQLCAGAHLNFDQCMQMEYRIAFRFLQGHDFYEGVRAVIIDKDQKPLWQPAQLTEVTMADVAKYFSPLEEIKELNFERCP